MARNASAQGPPGHGYPLRGYAGRTAAGGHESTGVSRLHGVFTFSIITRYEVRGLKAKNATAQLQAFDRLCAGSEIVPLTDAGVVKASEIYAELRRRGEPIGDADILISASALVNGLQLVTNNEDHFRRVPGLVVANWLWP